ncbi:hypothetical protein [Sphingobium nicotianae]|uniref:Uncharacterized protein n=1 Tax=Sphingobium nicotianae TaxID=2782607 RepID=A0A9X1IQ63_9SPHN|nr:hypothetical protein [Sphingobium nicotianae]MBT2186507.1 hypothetical protein [Sphingobium nicotianae]
MTPIFLSSRTILCLAVGLLLGGCAQSRAVKTAPASYAAEPALAVAQLLAAAEMVVAQPGADKPALAPTLAALDALGAHSAANEADPVPQWRALVPGGQSAPPMRGRMLGPAYRRGTVEAGARVTLDQLFDGGRQARVAVATPGALPVGMAVLDGAGKPVCPSIARQGQCNWVPPFSARHQIVISNPGAKPAVYYLVID